MKRNTSALSILLCLCFSLSFSLKAQNNTDPDPEFKQMEEYLSAGKISSMDMRNIRNKLKSGKSINTDIGNPPDWSWVRTFGGSGGIEVNDIALDGSGNLYILATFSDTIKILGHSFVSQGMRDVVVVKINNAWGGTYDWGSQLKSSIEQNVYGKSITVGTGGKVFITGLIDSSATITAGSIIKTQYEEEKTFICGLNNNGNFLWLKFDTEPGSIELHTDSKGDIYWMTTSLLNKLNPAGDSVWSKKIGSILIDFEINSGKIWVSGMVSGSGTIIADSVFIPQKYPYAVFLIEMDTTGSYLRTKFMETPGKYNIYYPPACIELDSKGNIYMSGYIYLIELNDTLIRNLSYTYIFKLNQDLETVWIFNDISNNARASTFSKSDDNRFYLYGNYSLTTSIDSLRIGNITVFPEDDITYGYYLAEIDSSGNVLRINTFTEDSKNHIVKSPDYLYRIFSDLFYNVEVEKVSLDETMHWTFPIEHTRGYASFRFTMDIDEDGNLYAQGSYRGQITVLNRILKGAGIIFVKFDDDGDIKWWRNMENPDGISSGIRADKYGNVYAWGVFNDYIKILDQRYNSGSGMDIYFIKFDKDGDLKFVKRFEGTNYITTSGAIDLDQKGNIIIAGSFTDTLKFGSYELISQKYLGNPTPDIFLSKFNPDGTIIWARNYNGTRSDYSYGLVVDEHDNIYLTGCYMDTIRFDTVIITKNIIGYDVFIAKLDPKGNVMWVKTGGSNNRYLRGMSIIAKDENIFVLGAANGPGPYYFDKGNITLTSTVDYNSFLARYETDGNMKWVKLIRANKNSTPMYRIDMDTACNVYIGGTFADTMAIEGNLIAGSSGYSYYLAKFDTTGSLKWVKTSDQSNTGDFQLYSLNVFEENVVLVAGGVTDGIAQVGDFRIVTAGASSFAGLMGKAIIGCVIDLKMDILHTQHGDSTGSAQVTILGGTAPYDITWSNGQKETLDETDNTAIIANQPAGIYQVYLEDSKGCVQYREFAINDLNGPVITIDSIHDASCAGYNNGFIKINVTGGTPPYQYSWSNGMKTEDIENLVAAPYEVVVTDANGYVAYQGFVVDEPKPLNITYDLYPASCGGGSDGRIDLFVSGGTKPYEYLWDNDWTTDDLTEISAGIYDVTVTDHNGCESYSKIALSEEGSSIVETDSIINAHCNIPDGQVSIKVLDAAGALSYKWNNGATTSNLSNVEGDKEYHVVVTNQTGCKTVHKVTVGLIPPPENPICLVTVDTATETNLVVWEKIEDTEMYYVFRETTEKDKYIQAGIVPGGALSVFTDSIADPHVRSYRYKIAAVDACGSVSILSTLHKTVHLRIYPELNTDNIIMAWDDYVGEDVASFEVWRYSSVFKWELLETMPSNLFSYIDENVPPGKVIYNVRVPVPDPCYPEGYGKAGSGPYSQSMSNMEDNRFLTGNVEIVLKSNFYLYPNPTTGKFIIWSETVDLKSAEILILDLQGRVIYRNKQKENPDGRMYIDLTGQAPGSYLVRIKSGGYNMFNKLIIQ